MPTSKWVALVPLRGGSKSIPLKNIKDIGGKPLCSWVLDAAKASDIFADIVVSTDDQRIASLVAERHPWAKILIRPTELATDSASTESVMIHFAQNFSFDVMCTIQATSPLTEPDDFIHARQLFEHNGFDSLLTAVRTRRFFWSDDNAPINYDPGNRPRRQDFKGTLMENGSFYFTKRAILNDFSSRLGGAIGVYEMHERTAIEIDEPADWIAVDKLLRETNPPGDFEIRARNLRYFFFDVDGTLTDGAMYYGSDGESLKRFSTRDGMGIAFLRASGVKVGLMTSEVSSIAEARAKKLALDFCFVGVKDKATCLKRFADEQGVDLQHVGFMGDDVNDTAALLLCGVGVCPADAVESVKAVVKIVTTHKGGNGAARELCDLIVGLRDNTRRGQQ